MSHSLVVLSYPLVYDNLLSDSVPRFQRGVRGYIEYQDIVNMHQYALFHQILEPTKTNLNLFMMGILDAAKFAVATEIKIRENERYSAIGKHMQGRSYSEAAQSYNRRALRAASSALRIIGDASEAQETLPASLAKMENAHREPEVKDLLLEAREFFVEGLAKFNFRTSEEFKEIVTIWDEATDVASTKGARGLLDHIKDNLEHFVKLRKQEDRGTKPHSPLPWWKWLIIAAYAGASVFSVIACFVWSACTWVWAAIGATWPIIKYMIDSGC